MKWELKDPHEIIESKAATKIQAIFRGRKARKEFQDKLKLKRKILARKIMKENKRYYMVSVYEEPDNFTVELNMADDPNTPMFMDLDSCALPKQEIDELFKTIKILPNHRFEISQENLEKPISKSNLGLRKGTLLVDICRATNVESSYCRVEYGDIFGHTTAGPPWDNKIVLRDIEFSTGVNPLNFKVFSLGSRNEIASSSIPWEISLKSPNNWTETIHISLPKNAKIEIKLL